MNEQVCTKAVDTCGYPVETTGNAVLDTLEHRSSTRAFARDDDDRPVAVTDEQRAAILHAASRAPSAGAMMMYSIISILLTCFGLFGMALYATKQRTKEIGIRKVNGASTRSIMLLLIRQFVKWIAVAFVIATPLAWVLLNRWLESFANRISISPLYFLMGGGIVLAITLLTVGWHSYRAASSNPVKSLKSE